VASKASDRFEEGGNHETGTAGTGRGRTRAERIKSVKPDRAWPLFPVRAKKAKQKKKKKQKKKNRARIPSGNHAEMRSALAKDPND